MTTPLIQGQAQALKRRALFEETCKFWNYTVGKDSNGRMCQIANYADDLGRPVAQKVRYPDKTFSWTGDPAQAGLYGKHLWKGASRKRVVITEGEIDALSVSQIFNNATPVVSLPNGAQAAVRALKKDLEWLEQFDEIVLMFDNDEPGVKAANDAAAILPPGKAKVVELPLKDANDMLQAQMAKELSTAIFNARAYRPDGIVSGAELRDSVLNAPAVVSYAYPWQGLNVKTLGRRGRELVTWTAGSGIGKSAVVAEIAYHAIKVHKQRVGFMMLEESVQRSALRLVGLELNKPIHLSRDGIAEEVIAGAFDNVVGTDLAYFYDHFGSLDVENLLSKIRYMAVVLGCEVIILDHLSIVISGLDDRDERRLIDNTMTKLRQLVEETGVSLMLVSHLKRPEGSRGHEEGAATSLSQLRGSHAIAQLSDLVIGLERNQQGDNPNETTVRVLKNRFSGDVGIASRLLYDKATGRLQELPGENVNPFESTPGGFEEEPDF